MIEHYQKVAFSGVEGSFTEEALTLFFKNNAGQMPEKICCEEFEDVFEAIRSGRADAGVLPLENSTTGSISATYDLLLRYGFYIKGEQTVSISHCLLGIPGAEILSFDDGKIHTCEYLETDSYQVMEMFINNRKELLKKLIGVTE